jgi:hypothetical protein
MNKTERDAIKEDLGVLRAILTSGKVSLDLNQGTRIHLEAAEELVLELLDRIDGWVSPHMKIDQPPRYTTARLQGIYNILRHQLGIEKADCGYAGYHMTGYGVIRLGHAENTLADIIRERKERKQWQRSGVETPQDVPGATSSTAPTAK